MQGKLKALKALLTYGIASARRELGLSETAGLRAGATGRSAAEHCCWRELQDTVLCAGREGKS